MTVRIGRMRLHARVCLYVGTNACFPDVLTKAQIKIAFPLHSLVKEIQEWIPVSDRLRRLRGAS
jgi:hypothetical protein